jgi:hypothetical protein
MGNVRSVWGANEGDDRLEGVTEQDARAECRGRWERGGTAIVWGGSIAEVEADSRLGMRTFRKTEERDVVRVKRLENKRGKQPIGPEAG